jgi:serine/threonine protein kinase
MIEDYTIIKELGYGMIGTIYLVKKDGKKYVMKIEKIDKKDIRKNLKSYVWREIDFAEKVANLYPDQFMQLIEYDIIPKCKHDQKYSTLFEDFGTVGSKIERNLKRVAKSEYCIRKIYSYVDSVFYNISLTQEAFYSLITQLAYAIHIMHSNGYTHNDLHTNNIGIKYTKRKYVKIFDYKIPTFGYQIQILDYGTVLNKKYSLRGKDFLNRSNKNIHTSNLKYELIGTIKSYLYSLYKNTDEINEKAIESFKKMKEYDIISKLVDSDDYDKLDLFGLMYPKKYSKIIKFKGNMENLIYTSVPIEDIIFILNFKGKNTKVLIDYFASKL